MSSERKRTSSRVTKRRQIKHLHINLLERRQTSWPSLHLLEPLKRCVALDFKNRSIAQLEIKSVLRPTKKGHVRSVRSSEFTCTSCPSLPFGHITACSVLDVSYTIISLFPLTEINITMSKMQLVVLLLAYMALAMACYVHHHNIAFLNQTYLSEFLEETNSNLTTGCFSVAFGESAETPWPPRPGPYTQPAEVTYCFRTANDREKLADVDTFFNYLFLYVLALTVTNIVSFAAQVWKDALGNWGETNGHGFAGLREYGYQGAYLTCYDGDSWNPKVAHGMLTIWSSEEGSNEAKQGNWLTVGFSQSN
jgi:hypothetical protein